jgi:hypothetical protein
MLTHDCGRRGYKGGLRAFVGGAVLACLAGSDCLAQTQASSSFAARDERVGRLARVASGSIEGIVIDGLGQVLPGATVSALGQTSAASVTDTHGRFAIRMLPAGSYIVRAHLAGFIPSRRELVNVSANGYARQTISLQREVIPTAVAGADPTAMPVLFGTPAIAGADRSGTLSPPPNPTSDDHSETAWRIRHLTRSVLKDTTDRVVLGNPSLTEPGGAPSASARILGSTLRSASSIFGTLPVTGEVNLLTMGALDEPLAMLSPQGLVNSVAYVSLRGRASSRGDWSAKFAVAQTDITSWFFSGAYRRHEPGRHVFDVGASYGLLRNVANPESGSASFWSRSAGSVYAIDRWTVAPFLSVTYGGSFSSYDYLPGVGYLSPKASVTFVPVRHLRVQTTLARSVIAPGSEEFLQPFAESLWVPAPRSFVILGGAAAAPVERVDHFEVSVERDLGARHVLAFRTFYQQVDDQQAMLFGSWVPLAVPGQQYAVMSAGDLCTRGWSVELSNALTDRLRGSVSYALIESNWGAPAADVVELVALGPTRAGTFERLHDLTTELETEIPYTDTHVFVIYRLNTGFARTVSEDEVRPGFDTRFDFQVTQRLPFLDFTQARWQVLFAVRNLFREAGGETSVYDELLVVRPPKRVVGGLVVRF